jgi:hypothetical protein
MKHCSVRAPLMLEQRQMDLPINKLSRYTPRRRLVGGVGERMFEVRHKKNETNPIAWEPRVGGERQRDGYTACSNLSS